MARFLPEDGVGLLRTPGADRLTAFLAGTLDDDHRVFVRPVLRDERRRRVPDVVLAGPSTGIVVLHVVPWRMGAVRPAGHSYVRVAEGGGEMRKERRPEEQAEGAARLLATRLARDAGLELPVGWALVYPFLSREDLRQLTAQGLVPKPDHALAGTGLTGEPADLGDAFLEALARGGSQPLSLSSDQWERVRAGVQPQIHFLDLREDPAVAPTPSPVPEEASDDEVVPVPAAPGPASPAPRPIDPRGRMLPATEPAFFLDRKQERMARELASPRTLVYGPAGSGKTVFLVARARYWLDQRPEARVLFTCYNSSLASHLRKQFALRGFAADDERLTVVHYHELCQNLLGMTDVDFHEQDEAFYAGLEPRLLRAMTERDDIPAYDLILVDEGQDFSHRMFEVLVRLVSPGGELTVVCDPAQDIYLRWRTSNLAPLGHYETEHLVDCYRNTAPIFAAALGVMDPDTRKAMGLSRLEMTRPEDLGREGPPPEFPRMTGLDDLLALVKTKVTEFREAGRPLSELAVLYPDRKAIPEFPRRLAASTWSCRNDARYRGMDDDGDDRVSAAVEGTLAPGDEPALATLPRPHFAEALEGELRAAGIPAEWVARDFLTKSRYDIAKDRLTLCTVHSAKGMDFHTVILLGAETLPEEDAERAVRSSALLFTGITRAREELLVPWFEATGWIPQLRAES